VVGEASGVGGRFVAWTGVAGTAVAGTAVGSGVGLLGADWTVGGAPVGAGMGSATATAGPQAVRMTTPASSQGAKRRVRNGDKITVTKLRHPHEDNVYQRRRAAWSSPWLIGRSYSNWQTAAEKRTDLPAGHQLERPVD